MTIRRRWMLFPLLICVCSPSFSNAHEPGKALRPHEVMEQVSKEILDAIDGRREELEANPEQLHHVVDTVLRPRFDVRYAARLVLAKYWSRATPPQRAAFMEALYASLVRRYAIGILYHSETRVRITPLRWKLPDPDQTEDFITVWTTVTLDDGTEVPVNYDMRWVDPAWKVYDVKIEGRSYVAYFRQVMRDRIDRKGLDAVIEELKNS